MLRTKRKERAKRPVSGLREPRIARGVQLWKEELPFKRKGFLFYDPYPTYRQLLAKTADREYCFGSDENGVMFVRPWQPAFQKAFETESKDEIGLFFVVPPDYVQEKQELVTDAQGIVRKRSTKEVIKVNGVLPNVFSEFVVHNKFTGRTMQCSLSGVGMPLSRRRCGHLVLKVLREIAVKTDA